MNKLILVLVEDPDPKSSLSSGMVRIKSSIARPWWIVPGRPCEVGSFELMRRKHCVVVIKRPEYEFKSAQTVYQTEVKRGNM